MNMKEGGVIQVAYVVRDLEAAMKRHMEVANVGPFASTNSSPARSRTRVRTHNQ